MLGYRFLLFIIGTFFISYVGAKTNPIIKINKEIEEIFFEINTFQFDKSYKKINDLINQCNKKDYLIGESELLTLKMQQAIALGDENLIYQWKKDYQKNIEQSITYGLIDKELYYDFLYLSIKILIDGFEYQRESIEDLIKKAERNGDHSTEAYLLFFLFQNLSGDDKDRADKQLEELFSTNEILKESWTYIAYQTIKGINILLASEDQINEISNIPQRIETLVYQAYQLLEEERYDEVLPLILEANDKEPNNFIILNELASIYLWLYSKGSGEGNLNQAEIVLLKALELAPDDEGVHYNLSCVYSRNNNIDKSLYHLEKSLEYGNTQYRWIMDDLDLENLRKTTNINDVINKYDKAILAYNYFSEAEKYSRILNLNKFNIISKYRKQVSLFNSFGHDQSESDSEEIVDLLAQVKKIYIDQYLLEILGLGQGLLENENYELAEKYLQEYIQTTEDLFDARLIYMENVLKSNIAQNYRDQSFEEFKASELVDPYENLAEVNLKLSNIEAFFKNMKQSISFEEILGTSNFLLIDKYTSLATEYSKIEDIANSKKYILQAERLLKRLDDLEIKMLSTKTIFDYYFSYGLENKEILFRKSLRLLNDVLKEAEDAGNYEYQYWCLLRLASIYHALDNNPGLQFDYFLRADSLLLEHNLKLDFDYMNWRFFSVMRDYNEFDIIRRITENNFEYYFSNKEYINAYQEGLENYYLYVYKSNKVFKENDFITLNKMLNKFDNIEKGEYWSLMFQTKKWQIELLHNDFNDNYNKSLNLIPKVMKIKNNHHQPRI